jgi:hypothetical protein
MRIRSRTKQSSDRTEGQDVTADNSGLNNPDVGYFGKTTYVEPVAQVKVRNNPTFQSQLFMQHSYHTVKPEGHRYESFEQVGHAAAGQSIEDRPSTARPHRARTAACHKDGKRELPPSGRPGGFEEPD